MSQGRPLAWSSPQCLPDPVQSEVARTYGVSQGWISRLMTRYSAEGESAFEPRSRAPENLPERHRGRDCRPGPRLRKQLSEDGLDAGADTIDWHLSSTTTAPSCRGPRSTGSWSGPVPGRPGPFQATQVLLPPLRSRPAQPELAVRLHPLPTRRTAPMPRSSPGSMTIPATPCTAPPTAGSPARSCSPRSVRPLTCTASPPPRSPTTAWSSPPASPAAAAAATASSTNSARLRHRPEELPTQPPHHLRQSRTLPADPQEVATRPTRPADHASPSSRPCSTRSPTSYNHRRPHRSLPHRATPAAVYTARPKASPATDRSTDTHDRVRHDRVDHSGTVTLRFDGRLHHIGIGRTHARTHVLLLVHDLHVRVVNATTGELLRELTIDPTPRLPAHRPTTRTHPETEKPEPTNVGSGYSDVLDITERPWQESNLRPRD